MLRVLISALACAFAFAGSPALEAPPAILASLSTPSGQTNLILGDIDCDQDVDSVDALQGLRDLSGLPASTDCIDDAGDTDCDGDRDSVDSLRILKHAAALPNDTPPGCPAIGTPVGGVLLLNEVLFAAGDDDPFVELKAAGGPAGTSGLTLVNERDDEFAVPNSGQLAEDAVLLLDFGGSDFIDADAGFVELRDGDDLLDRVAWGDEFADAVNLSNGGTISAPLPDGASIGRPPAANVPRDRLQWAVYYTDASPGAQNANVSIGARTPPDGSWIEGDSQTYLSWQPVAGASSYTVQLAMAGDPGNPILDQTVDEPRVTVGALADGEYVWTVRPVADSGDAAPASDVIGFTVSDSPFGAAPAGTPGSEALLDVEYLTYKKDTSMLHLEAKEDFEEGLGGDHFWDSPHGSTDEADPVDRNLQAQAVIAMINSYLGGHVSQDRLSYEVFNDRAPGPERDLNYGDALSLARIEQMAIFAFGGFEELCSNDEDEMWNYIKESIDSDRPLIGFRGLGGVVNPNDPPTIASPWQAVQAITGYHVTDPPLGVQPLRMVGVNDPGWYEPFASELNELYYGCLWRPPAAAVGFTQEASITIDSDGDDVVDFDEIMRFNTDPNDIDTDHDGLTDKEDIAESVYGVLANGSPSKLGRDWDTDSVPAEHDCDNDSDGIIDGEDDDVFSSPDVPNTSLCGVLLRFTSHPDGVITSEDSLPCVLWPEDTCTAYRVTFSVAWSGLTAPATVECSASGGRDKQEYPALAPIGSRDFELNFGSWQFDFDPFISCSLLDEEGGTLDFINAQTQV